MVPKCSLLLLAILGLGLLISAEEQTYSTNWECNVNDPLSCDQSKSEVCIFKDGSYSCECPTGVSRLKDGRCLLIDECAQPRLNDCHENARCIDQAEGYICECHAGYADISEDPVNKPGRICQEKTNECAEPEKYNVDCSENAVCQDTSESFTCVCRPGFVDISEQYSKLPGRKCVEVVNECVTGNNDCSPNADCIDQKDGYTCQCRQGYIDASPNVTHYPGRQCNAPKSSDYYGKVELQPSSQCHPVHQPVCTLYEVCKSDGGKNERYSCRCEPPAVVTTDGKCRAFNACETSNDCDRFAICTTTFDGYKCQCPPGFLDLSSDPIHSPGRVCKRLENECADRTLNDCSPNARCEDTQESYSCKCNEGYTDISTLYNLSPGRKCVAANSPDRCLDRLQNACDENADCISSLNGYTCQCSSGYIDVSSNANLPPGRVCTLHTTCPAQPTDLVFIIDGSGSISSAIFKDEVLRFVSEFVDLFDIGPEKTRVAVVQYAEKNILEFPLNEYTTNESLKSAIGQIKYVAGLTRTGAAIQFATDEVFNERNGARPVSNSVSRVAIVITDGRSQDDVRVAARRARNQNIQLFAVGVTNHILDSELESIAGSKERYFHVSGFKELNARLRSIIQKATCPYTPEPPTPSPGGCDASTHKGCDRTRNQVCTLVKDADGNQNYRCTCPPRFEKHSVTQECGGQLCNPDLQYLCPDPEVCERTPFGNFRCVCPSEYRRDNRTGACKSAKAPPPAGCGYLNSCGNNEQCVQGRCECLPQFVRDPRTDKCLPPGTCDQSSPDSCDQRKHEKCLFDQKARKYTCQCPANFRRDPVKQICLVDECAMGKHDCDPNAECIDTAESFICTCKEGFRDISPDESKKPGRVCKQEINECQTGTHNCSVNADCYDTIDAFICRCKEGFIDFSPNPQQFGGTTCNPLVNECADKTLNTCSENAICTDTRESYTCLCKIGFVDQHELTNPGRVCTKTNDLCEEGKNDCDKNAKCIERGADGYECVCNVGYTDKSPEPIRPGRKCVEQVCSDPKRHNCHPAAICTEVVGPEGYKCTCRDGFVDKNPSNPGRECKEEVDECRDGSLNDCSPIAKCRDTKEGYDCTCPFNTRDDSPDQSKPGRVCTVLVNECSNPHLNNCSRFADCIDNEDGYECRCRKEYHDNNPEKPGTECTFIQNECEQPNLNDCHKKHAKCIDTPESYTCECIAPYMDYSPQNPGRDCRYNECADPKMHDCHPQADCLDTDEGFTCRCGPGYYDDGKDPRKPGRDCKKYTSPPPLITTSTVAPDCGTAFCDRNLDEVCIGGERCGCRPGANRASKTEKCINVVKVPITIPVIRDGERTLVYGSDYGSPNKPSYVEVADKFTKGVGDVIKQTHLAPAYVATDLAYITNPKVVDSSMDSGLLFNGTADFSSNVEKCELWDELMRSFKENDYRLGKQDLVVAKGIEQLDPCKPPSVPENPCGNSFCRKELGEVCFADRLCGCPSGQKRSRENERCREVEPYKLILWVIREGKNDLNYTDNLANPHDKEQKRLVEAFEKGITDSYSHTPLRTGYVVSEVNDILKPDTVNKTWNHGILYNFTASFIRGTIESPKKVFTDLVEYIKKKNNGEIGHSKQFISPEQMDPLCAEAKCHHAATCDIIGNKAICHCPSDYRDKNPSNPGHDCLGGIINECESSELNDCDANARCIDQPHLYRCECNPGYENAAKPGELPGSVCRANFCLDANFFCPENTTCVNHQDNATCECLKGFVDLRKSPRGYEPQAYCLGLADVDECALGITDCSGDAICTDLRDGYKCECREGFTDGNTTNPGHLCVGIPGRVCALCNYHGDCIVHEGNINNITCACLEGYTGEHCEVAPSVIPLVLLIVLATLFLLLTLCCCLYFCLKTKCFGGRRGLSAGTSSVGIIDSEPYTIPRPKIVDKTYGAEDDAYARGRRDAQALERYFDGGASVSSGSSVEEVERRVITDVTRSEVRTTTVTDADGGVTSRTVYGVTSAKASGDDQGRNAQFVVHSPIETEAEQYATTTDDHRFVRAAAAADNAASSGLLGSTSRHLGQRYEDEESVSGDSNVEEGAYDRTTTLTTHRGFEPAGEGRGGTERLRNVFHMSTSAHETNYF